MLLCHVVFRSLPALSFVLSWSLLLHLLLSSFSLCLAMWPSLASNAWTQRPEELEPATAPNLLGSFFVSIASTPKEVGLAFCF